ncbi:glycosyltransferase [Paludisphaera rhizosphaerae]|uniref:glycosyltransferase n=1 Tax=Paludisphaera rhizosphaerae TaxID=2711216 RepID=UPI0013ED3851|nr:glycosyltransferase [Paludisphaera rhizosphaerae]
MSDRSDGPALSVVIPARNEAALLGETLESVLRAIDEFAAPGDVEVVVVDDGSSDGTPALLEQYAADHGVVVVKCEVRGAARARNLGVRRARGRILVFLDADTHPPADGLRRIATLCDEHGFEAGITRLGALDGGLRARCWWGFWNTVRRLPLPRAKAMPACMFCTREAFDEFGPFDERVAIGEEWPILAGLYRARPRRFVYDRSRVALSSGRRMELQRWGYLRTFLKYGWAIVSFRGRVHYHDQIRHAAPQVDVG